MGENSKIEWTDHTFNPWIGCQKVSLGCDNCYAEALMDNRYGKVQWGPHGERKRTSAANWRKPRQWANAAAREGWITAPFRQRVFCASLADVFDNQVPSEWREDLLDLIRATPELDWLLLTKRPENLDMWSNVHWPNVWLGVTCEDQKHYDRRWPLLAEITGVPVRFISYEPALGPLIPHNAGRRRQGHVYKYVLPDWIICGGESGANARPMHSQWVRDLCNQCQALGVAFFFKQWGEWAPAFGDSSRERLAVCRYGLGNFKIKAGEKARQFDLLDRSQMIRVGKKIAGRVLDGRTWDEFPMIGREDERTADDDRRNLGEEKDRS